MDRKNVKWRKKNRTRESSHEQQRIHRTDSASWKSIALSILGALESLDCVVLLYLFAADRLGVLVAVAVLACKLDGRRADFANAASVGGLIFLLCSGADVRLLGSTDE